MGRGFYALYQDSSETAERPAAFSSPKADLSREDCYPSSLAAPIRIINSKLYIYSARGLRSQIAQKRMPTMKMIRTSINAKISQSTVVLICRGVRIRYVHTKCVCAREKEQVCYVSLFLFRKKKSLLGIQKEKVRCEASQNREEKNCR